MRRVTDRRWGAIAPAAEMSLEGRKPQLRSLQLASSDGVRRVVRRAAWAGMVRMVEEFERTERVVVACGPAVVDSARTTRFAALAGGWLRYRPTDEDADDDSTKRLAVLVGQAGLVQGGSLPQLVAPIQAQVDIRRGTDQEPEPNEVALSPSTSLAGPPNVHSVHSLSPPPLAPP